MKMDPRDDSAADALHPLTELDRLLHEPGRLLIMSFLWVTTSADFLFLLRHTGLTRGNLSSHMSKLEAAGYVEVEKKFVDKTPLTVYHLTDTGREAFRAYRAGLMDALGALPD
ncbi:MAG: transcriptional regulator [Acidobacteriota bacterium]|jgi:DNA-binding MarR family transcriptional regulator